MPELFKKRWFHHTLSWVGLFVLINSVAWIGSGAKPEALWVIVKESFLFFFWPTIPLTYLSFYLKAKFYDRRKYLTYFLTFPFQVAFGVGSYQLNYFLLDFEQPALQDISNVFFLIVLGIAIQYFKRGVVGQYQLQELRARTAEMELNALRTQINPHFLFNTLNNIYAVNQLNPEKGSEMIMELSEVMRYHLHFSKMKKVPLEDELQLAQAYVELEKLRLNDTCRVSFRNEIKDGTLKIAPLVFLPFLENAFKHGAHSTLPSFVDVFVTSEKDKVIFEVKNSLFKDKNVIRTGIGQENTRRRLALVYPRRHSLNIEESMNEYTVYLELIL